MTERMSDADEMSRNRIVRRTLLRGAALGAAAPLLPAAMARAGEEGAAPATVRADSASLKWLGTSGWRIDIGSAPFSRPVHHPVPTGLFAGRSTPIPH